MSPRVRTQLRIVRPLIPAAPREEINDSVEQLVADRRSATRPDGAPLDYAEPDTTEHSGVDLVPKILLASICALGVIALLIGFSAGGGFE